MAGADTAAQAPVAHQARPGKGAWMALAILCFVYVLNFLDRQLLSILANKTNRTRVLAFACALWSAATVVCGLSATYPQLVAARMAVGVGEAGGVPPSYAIISDLFPPGQRGTALGLFNLGPPIGQALGVAFGASIAAAYSWRDAFVSLGAVGIVAAVIVFVFVREPKRGGLDVAPVIDPSAAKVAPASFWATCRMFFARPVLLLVALACGATQFITYAVLNFTTLFLMREKGMTLSQVALYYALLIGVSISAGIYASGRLTDRLVPKSKRAYALIPAVGLTIAAPFFVGFVWAPTWPLALAFLAIPTALNYFYLSPAVTLVQQEVAPHQRVLSGALLLLVMNLIGLGLGPTYVGAVSDHFRASHPHNSLQLAFYSLVPFYVVAVALFLALARALKKESSSGAAA